jgi:hypothetical protein
MLAEEIHEQRKVPLCISFLFGEVTLDVLSLKQKELLRGPEFVPDASVST